MRNKQQQEFQNFKSNLLHAEVQRNITGLTGETLVPFFLHISTKENNKTLLKMYN